MDRLIIHEDGSLHLDGDEHRRRLSSRAGGYRLILDIPGLLVLRRDSGQSPQRARIMMAGEIIGQSTVMDVINVIANANWRGELHVFGREAHRMLTFDQGALKHASSNHPSDRLGEVLFHLGVLSRAQIDDITNEESDQRFGQRLIARKLLDQQGLFGFLGKQAEQIFFNAMLIGEGHYLFGVPEDPSAIPSATIHIPLQTLLMEGVQRIDEMALFREKIPHNHVYPEAVQPIESLDLDPVAQRVLIHSDGRHSVDDIARLAGCGEFKAVKALYQLVQAGRVLLRTDGPRIDPIAVSRLVRQFSEVMQDIFITAATYENMEHTRQTLLSWMRESGYGKLLGYHLNDDASIDEARVLKALREHDPHHPLQELHYALHQVAAFALFAATDPLPRDQERTLAHDITQRLNAIRI